MKRMIMGMIVTLVLLGSAPAQAVSLDSLTITDFDVEMTLGRDGEQRSTLDVTETITANFAQRNTNRGIERAFAKDYDGHPTDFQLQSVTDESGAKLPYHWSGDTLRIGEKNTYVHGEQTYVIEYSQRDVTKEYEDTGKAEWYWDVIGDEWRVPIERASVEVTVDDELVDAIETDMQCYAGESGSSDRCDANGSNGIYLASADNLGLGKGMTMALGFAPGTFAQYELPLWQKILLGYGAISLVGGLVIFAAGAVYFFRKKKTFEDRGVARIESLATIPEYLPPKDTPVIVSAVTQRYGQSGTTLPAQIIEWAVNRYVSIVTAKTGAGEKIVIEKSFDDLTKHEQSLATALFGQMPKRGVSSSMYEIGRRKTAIKKAIEDAKREIKKGDLYAKRPEQISWQNNFSKKMLFAFAITLLNSGFLLLAVLSWLFSQSTFLSEKGARLRKYLDGLKQYIKVGEAERLAMLQSPEGAEKVGMAGGDDLERIKLYERNLPYAVLFGYERQWAKELGSLYETTGTSPEWSTGTNISNAASMSSFVQNFSSTTRSASGYVSKSGGSSGGGIVGGGGGGGGGGGW